MPRLLPTLLQQAAQESRYLRPLLRECRDLPSARNELRWLKEHAYEVHRGRGGLSKQELLRSYVRRRSCAEPLQYIIGNHPFGDLEILCRSGVLIPRPETELYTQKIATLLKELRDAGNLERRRLGILDLCTGTGCIALLLHSLLSQTQPHADQALERVLISAVDVSDRALRLARHNLEHNIRLASISTNARQDISFLKADLLEPSKSLMRTLNVKHPFSGTYDVVVSNPPYISPSDHAPGGRTTRSVWKYEPRKALVPPSLANSKGDQADAFYHKIINIAQLVDAKLVCMEVGDLEQARRVVAIVEEYMQQASIGSMSPIAEIWCDDETVHTVDVGSKQDKVVVNGLERAVVVWKGRWAQWRKEQRRRSS